MNGIVFHTMKLGNEKINGGVPKVYLSTLKSLKSINIKVTAIMSIDNETMEQSSLEIVSDVKCINIEIPTLSLDSGGINKILILKKIFNILKSFYKYRRLNKNTEYDFILVHDLTSMIYLGIFKAKKKIVYLHTYRPFVNKMTQKFIKILNFIYKNTYFIAPTVDIKNSIIALGANKKNVFLMATPFKLEQLNNNTRVKLNDHLEFVYIGRISPIKNLLSMLKFIKKLNENNLLTNLDIYGIPFTEEQKVYNSKLVKYIDENNLNKFIKFKGHTSEPIKIFSQYDASLIFSDGEAIPLAGLESFCANTPVIGYRTPGITDLIGLQNERGILFDKDNEEEIISKITEIKTKYHNNSIYKSYIEEFTEDSWSNNFSKIFLKGHTK